MRSVGRACIASGEAGRMRGKVVMLDTWSC